VARDDRMIVCMLGLGGGIWVLSAWLTWQHYFTLLIPLLLLSLRPVAASAGGRAAVGMRRFVFAAALASSNTLVAGLLGAASNHQRAVLLNVAGLLLFILALWETLAAGRDPLPVRT
jgi:hypothetical protein